MSTTTLKCCVISFSMSVLASVILAHAESNVSVETLRQLAAGTEARTFLGKAQVNRSVNDFGAIKTGTGDNAAAFAACAAEGRQCLVEPGVYRFTSGVTLTAGADFECVAGRGVGGTADADPKLCTLVKEFSGDLFTIFPSSTAAIATAGYTFRRLTLLNRFGSPGTPTGNAIKFLTTRDARPSWVMIDALNVEIDSAYGEWTRSLFLEGSPYTVNLGQGIRDVWISNSRFYAGEGATAAIEARNVQNLLMVSTFANGTKGDFVFTGPNATYATQGVYMFGGGGSVLSLDHLTVSHFIGVSFGSISSTANVLTSTYVGRVTTVPAPVPGLAMRVIDGTQSVESDYNFSRTIGRDLMAGDSTQRVTVGIGNITPGQGALYSEFTNSAAADAPRARFRFVPRNNADTAAIEIAAIEMQKTAGADTGSLKLQANFGAGLVDALTVAASSVSTFAGPLRVSGTLAQIRSGAGSPEGAISAPVGSIYTRTDGGVGTTLYIKESGVGNTGWVAK